MSTMKWLTLDACRAIKPSARSSMYHMYCCNPLCTTCTAAILYLYCCCCGRLKCTFVCIRQAPLGLHQRFRGQTTAAWNQCGVISAAVKGSSLHPTRCRATPEAKYYCVHEHAHSLFNNPPLTTRGHRSRVPTRRLCGIAALRTDSARAVEIHKKTSAER